MCSPKVILAWIKFAGASKLGSQEGNKICEIS